MSRNWTPILIGLCEFLVEELEAYAKDDEEAQMLHNSGARGAPYDSIDFTVRTAKDVINKVKEDTSG